MTALAFADVEPELANTRRLLERVPADRLDWQPHPKSMTLGFLASHVAELPAFAAMMLAAPDYDFATGGWKPARAGSTAELLEIFDREAAGLRAAVAAATPASLEAQWTMMHGGHVIRTGRRGELARHIGLNHLVHHRGQLGVFLRLLDVPIPGMYGPSADEG